MASRTIAKAPMAMAPTAAAPSANASMLTAGGASAGPGDVAWHGRLPHRNAGDGGIGWKREVEPISLSRVDLNGVTRGTVAARRDHRTFGATTSVSGGTPWGTSIFSWEQRRVTPARRFAASVSRTSRTRWRAASPIFG